MLRKITGYHKDDAYDWVAELECYHNQHVRHRPPFQVRKWTQSKSGRDSMLGSELECVLCNDLVWPEALVFKRRTPEFNQQDFPEGLKKDHSTKAGVWGRITVVEGLLHYHCDAPVDRSILLEAGMSAAIPPGLRHRVEPQGPVRFYVEFFARVAQPT